MTTKLYPERSAVFLSDLCHCRQVAQGTPQAWRMVGKVDRTWPALAESGSISLPVNETLLMERLGRTTRLINNNKLRMYVCMYLTLLPP